jgi:hypothetical protein
MIVQKTGRVHQKPEVLPNFLETQTIMQTQLQVRYLPISGWQEKDTTRELGTPSMVIP